MTYQIHYTDEIYQDLRNIYEYVAINCLAPLSAANLVHKIVDRIFELESFPARFRLVDDEEIKVKDLHIFSVDKYNIYYFIDEKEKVVTILRILYSGMNVSKILNKYSE